MLSKWKEASHKIQNVSHWKNNESTTSAYTAKAAYDIYTSYNIREVKGQCIDIDQKKTVIELFCGEKTSIFCLKYSVNYCTKFMPIIINLFFYLLGYFLLCNEKSISNVNLIGLVWLIVPIQNLLIANRDILWRIWRKSMLPYIQLYLSLIETYAFCDLCNWDNRICLVAPPLLFNQILIINSDAVFFKKENKKIIIIQILVSVFWKFCFMFALRFGQFENLYPSDMFIIMINPITVSLTNITVFTGKTFSMIFLLLGQIYFRTKNIEQLYSLRTHYTVKPNKVWNELNRKNRISRHESLENDVFKTKEILKTIVV
tara:strand:- start:925 stop:1872 length:948 start_codon:yes stop_codon:yes gene_type:complete